MNRVVLMGRLTKDTELRYTSASNLAVCSFTLAVDRRFSKQSENKQADFFPIVVWNKLAEFCSKYFVKGLQVVVSGRLQTRTWDDNDGKRHYITEIVADEAYFADSKKGSSAVPNDSFNANAQSSSQQEGSSQEGFLPIEEDDDLPF